MQLNIKDAETCAMIGELAEVTGTTKAGIVKEMARERLDRIAAEREADIARRLASVREITARIRERMPKPLPTQKELDDWMYDEDGLPR